MNCSLPKVLNSTALLGSKQSLQNTGSGDGKKQKRENSIVSNTEMIIDAWKLSREEELKFKSIFDHATLIKRPDHSSGCKLCHKWAVKNYCFSDCNNKGSHTSWSLSEKNRFDSFLKEARRS